MKSCGTRWDEVYDHRPISACMTYWKHFQYWSAYTKHFQYWVVKTPCKWFLTTVEELSEKIFRTSCARLFHIPTLRFSRTNSKELVPALHHGDKCTCLFQPTPFHCTACSSPTSWTSQFTWAKVSGIISLISEPFESGSSSPKQTHEQHNSGCGQSTPVLFPCCNILLPLLPY